MFDPGSQATEKKIPGQARDDCAWVNNHHPERVLLTSSFYRPFILNHEFSSGFSVSPEILSQALIKGTVVPNSCEV